MKVILAKPEVECDRKKGKGGKKKIEKRGWEGGGKGGKRKGNCVASFGIKEKGGGKGKRKEERKERKLVAV